MRSTMLLLATLVGACAVSTNPGPDVATDGDVHEAALPSDAKGPEADATPAEALADPGPEASPGCGDNACNAGETCATCPDDCGPCAPGCGNGTCSGFETCTTCPQDCCPDAGGPDVVDASPDAPSDAAGPDAPADAGPDRPDAGLVCGDGTCADEEHCFTCPDDCGPCSACGDGDCGPDESCATCPDDCAECQPSDGCETSEAGGCGGCTCEACVCGDDPYCCTVKWDSVCVETCELDCGGCHELLDCGDGWCEGEETCTLCPDDCGDCDNPGCRLHDTAGCVGCLCEEVVCADDPACCLGHWDDTCVQECADAGFCASDGCHATPIPGCNGCACQEAVCADDPVCCEDEWDTWCVGACLDTGTCGP